MRLPFPRPRLGADPRCAGGPQPRFLYARPPLPRQSGHARLAGPSAGAGGAFASLSLPLTTPEAGESLLVTVTFQEKEGGFLRVSWQNGQGEQVLSNNFLRGRGHDGPAHPAHPGRSGAGRGSARPAGQRHDPGRGTDSSRMAGEPDRARLAGAAGTRRSFRRRARPSPPPRWTASRPGRSCPASTARSSRCRSRPPRSGSNRGSNSACNSTEFAGRAALLRGIGPALGPPSRALDQPAAGRHHHAGGPGSRRRRVLSGHQPALRGLAQRLRLLPPALLRVGLNSLQISVESDTPAGGRGG